MTMTRVSFCPRCHSAGRPKTNQKFVAWGDKRQSFIVFESLRIGRTGFTPHNFDFKRLVDGTVYYYVCCSMVGCGTCATEDHKNKNKFSVGFNWDNHKMKLNDWNALVNYKRDEDFEI